jgi:hypothetical protein
MAESALTIGYPEIAQDVAEHLGYNPTIASLTSNQQRIVNRALDSGLRRFVSERRWAFLEQTATITTVSGTESYSLPDDYGSPVQAYFYYPSSVGYSPVYIVSKAELDRQRSVLDADGPPQYAAIYADTTDGASGQRFSVVLAPTPNSAYTLTGEYNILLDVRMRSGTPYPPGGMIHAETIRLACLSAADAEVRGTSGLYEARYREALARSIRHDDNLMGSYVGNEHVKRGSRYPARSLGGKLTIEIS